MLRVFVLHIKPEDRDNRMDELLLNHVYYDES